MDASFARSSHRASLKRFDASLQNELQQYPVNTLTRLVVRGSLSVFYPPKLPIAFYQTPRKLRVYLYDADERKILSYKIEFQITSQAPISAVHPMDTGNVSRIRNWLDECERSHPSCRSSISDYTPTRLIHIQDSLLRLVEFTKPVPSVRYVALSYCWGPLQADQMSFMTTKKNIAARISGFEATELPRTLSDCIRVSQDLGIHYVWIDALCIVQDDHSDWSTEAAAMDMTYGHAFLTIAATTSSSSFDTFLDARAKNIRASINFQMQEHSGKVHRGLIHFRFPRVVSIKKSLSKCEWNKRGWTFQEKLLSSRILYFLDETLYFECYSAQFAEDPGYALPTAVRLPAFERQLATTVETNGHQSNYNLFSNWYRLVDDFSFRNLTKPSDKLPAMAGLAARFKSLTGDAYTYGLWQSDIYRGLLWISHNAPYHDRAPSWSWTSRDRGTSWDPSTLGHGWISLIEVHSIYPGPSVSTGYDASGDGHIVLDGSTALVKDLMVAYDEMEMGAEQYNAIDLSIIEYDHMGTFLLDHESKPLDGTRTWLLLIAQKAEPKNVQGLLIQQTANEGEFCRVGIFIQKQTIGKVKKEDDAYDFFAHIPNIFTKTRVRLV